MDNQQDSLSQSAKKAICSEEYNFLIGRLNIFNTTKNSILTFSFTAVLTLLGVIVASDNPISPVLCLIPYLLIVPFSARISYYRIASAHIITFLKTFAPEKTVFANGTNYVPEKNTKLFPAIAWLINHEMVILAIAVGVVYFYQYLNHLVYFSYMDIPLLSMPIPFIAIVFFISDSTYNYKKLCDSYSPKWNEYLRTMNTQER